MPANFSANFDRKFFCLVFQGCRPTQTIHAQNPCPNMSAFLSNFTFTNPKISSDFLLMGETKSSVTGPHKKVCRNSSRPPWQLYANPSEFPQIRKAPDTFQFLRHVVRAILSVRPNCSHRCASLKESPLEPVQILKHAARISTEQTSMRTKDI